MTDEQKSKCNAIIHSHAVLAGAGNAVPLPGVGVAADITTMTTMAMSLAAVFGASIPKEVAKNMAVVAIKKVVLKQPLKTLGKELVKFIPFAGSIIAASASVAMLESAGWVLAKQMEERVKNN